MSGSGPGRSRLGFHVLTVLALAVCLVAARWQWDRAHRTAADAVPDVPAVALADLDPQSAYPGMRVTVTGRFDPDHDVLVAPRERDGRSGAWVLTPLLPAGTETGSAGTAAVAIVRGWVPQGVPPDAPPLGDVSVVGVLVSDSREPGVTVQGVPAALQAVDTGALAAYAGYPVRSGWLALQSPEPTEAGQPVPLDVTDLPGAEVGLNWRNFAYAVQWIAFAGFVLFFWNRFRRDLDEHDHEQETAR
jgi:cytochrome oxidase assembly protein ShyY1